MTRNGIEHCLFDLRTRSGAARSLAARREHAFTVAGGRITSASTMTRRTGCTPYLETSRTRSGHSRFAAVRVGVTLVADRACAGGAPCGDCRAQLGNAPPLAAPALTLPPLAAPPLTPPPLAAPSFTLPPLTPPPPPLTLPPPPLTLPSPSLTPPPPLPSTSVATGAGPPAARFEDAPPVRVRRTPCTFRVAFGEAVATSGGTMRDHALTVAGPPASSAAAGRAGRAGEVRGGRPRRGGRGAIVRRNPARARRPHARGGAP